MLSSCKFTQLNGILLLVNCSKYFFIFNMTNISAIF